VAAGALHAIVHAGGECGGVPDLLQRAPHTGIVWRPCWRRRGPAQSRRPRTHAAPPPRGPLVAAPVLHVGVHGLEDAEELPRDKSR
jgi:hypothetical protein